MKDKSYDDLMKIDKQDLLELLNIKYKIHHTVSDGIDDANYKVKFGASAGDPLRSERNGPLLDRVFKDRGLDPPTYGVPKNYEGPPPLGYRPEAYPNIKQKPRGEYEYDFLSVDTTQGLKDLNLDIPSSIIPKMLPSGTTTKQDIDTLFEAMDEEGALLEFPELGKKLNRYTFNNDRDALIEAITDEDYPAYEAAMKGMLKRTFPSGKIPVRRVENYTELQLFGTKDPETLAMMEQAGLQKLKDQKKIVTEKLIDIDDVKFVGNPAEEELIILDTPREFRKGAMIGDKQLLSYTINLPKKVEKKAKGGIAGLSDVARDMFKGPKGIGAYQPFMVG